MVLVDSVVKVSSAKITVTKPKEEQPEKAVASKAVADDTSDKEVETEVKGKKKK